MKIFRNEKCKCGSGLKFKKCHGDDALRLVCQEHANLRFLQTITRRRLKAKIISEDEYSQLMFVISERLHSEDNSDPCEEQQKSALQAEGRNIADLRVGLTPCKSCGRMLPSNNTCKKCEGKHDEARESQGNVH